MVAIVGDLITGRTVANKRSDIVPAHSIPAQEGHHMTLVDVDAIVIVTKFKSDVAMALVRSDCVNARAIVADVGSSTAFIYIDAHVPRGRQKVSRIADTLETSL